MAALALTAIAATGSSASAQIRVVATTPDLASVAREIGGDKVSVVALAKPTEDPHYVDAKPSHIVTLNRADALIEGGAELELGWLPPLLENSRNSKISAGAPGRIVASDGVKMLEIPTSFDRSKGDVHSLGNPHFMIDPVNVKIIARNIADHFRADRSKECGDVQRQPGEVQHQARREVCRLAEAARAVSRREDRDVPQGLRLPGRSVRAERSSTSWSPSPASRRRPRTSPRSSAR